MALRSIEGFDYLPTSLNSNEAELNRVLSAAGFYALNQFATTQIVEGGRFGYGNCARLSFGSIGKAFNRVDDVYTGFAVKPMQDNGTGGPTNFIVVRVHFVDTATDRVLCRVVVNSYGVVQVYDADSQLVGASEANAFNANNWFFFEARCNRVYTDSTGTYGLVEARINTTTVISLPVIKLGVPSIPYFGIGAVTLQGGSPNVSFIDDWYILDSEEDYNNSYLGNVRVQWNSINGTGNQTEWTPVSPVLPNWENANNNLLTDASFVSSLPDQPDEYDLYTVAPLVNSPNIYGVSVKGAYRQTDANQLVAKNAVRTNSTDLFGTPKPTHQTYTYIEDILDLNPVTGLGWTYAEVNSLQIGPGNGGTT